MVRIKQLVAPVVVVAVLALVAVPVYAHCGKCAGSAKDMCSKMDAGKVTLASAISAAEAHSKGKAVSASAELAGANLGFEVYCLVGDKLMEVTVDGAGKATKMEDAKMMPGDGHAGHGDAPKAAAPAAKPAAPAAPAAEKKPEAKPEEKKKEEPKKP